MRRILLLLAALVLTPCAARAQGVAGPVDYGALPACNDAGGSHLNYAAGAFGCGSSVGANVTQRPPGIGDDSTWNFNVGDFWAGPRSLWQSTLNTAGAAAWVPVGDTSPYLDKQVTAPLFAYSVRQIVSGYAGSCLDLYDTAHSTTQTLGFVNGACDWATGDGFAATPGATVVVSKVYDQSGNAYNLTCATNYTTCLTYSQFRMNGVRTLQWDDDYRQVQGTTPPRMVNTAVAITNERAFSVAFIGRFHNGGQGQLPISMGSGSAWDQYFIHAGQWGVFDSTNGQFSFFSSAGDAEPGLSLIVSSATPEVGYFNDRQITVGNSDPTSQALTGIGIGGPSGLGTGTVGATYALTFDAYAIVGFNSTLMAAQIAALRQWSYSTWPIAPQLRSQLVVLGDSMMSGWGQPFNQSAMLDVRQMLTTPRREINLAEGGQTCTTLTSNFGAGYYTAPIAWGLGHNVIYGTCGANDIIGGATAATTEANITAWVAAIRAKDPNDPLILQNLWNFGGASPTYESVREVVNTWFVANCATLVAPKGACIDFSADSRIGVAGASANAAYFNADQLHLNAAGAGIAAAVIYNTLKAWQ